MESPSSTTRNHIEWYDSPSSSLTDSGRRINTPRVPLRSLVSKEVLEKSFGGKIIELSSNSDDEEDFSYFPPCTSGATKSLSDLIKEDAPDLVWKQEDEKNNQENSFAAELAKVYDTNKLSVDNKKISEEIPEIPEISEMPATIACSTPVKSPAVASMPSTPKLAPKLIVFRSKKPKDRRTPVKSPKVEPPTQVSFDDSFDDDLFTKNVAFDDSFDDDLFTNVDGLLQ